MAARKRAKAEDRRPIGHCPECDDMRVVVLGSGKGREARTCGCVLLWRMANGAAPESGKDRSAGR